LALGAGNNDNNWPNSERIPNMLVFGPVAADGGMARGTRYVVIIANR